MKTAIRVSVLVIIIAAAGAGGYYILKGVNLPTFPEVEEIVPFQIGGGGGGLINLGGEEPKKEEEKTSEETGNLLEKVSDGAVFAYSVVSDSEIYYLVSDGRVFKVAAEGDSISSEKTLTSLNGVWVTSDGKRALVSFGDPKNPEWSIYDFLDAAWRPLPKTIAYAAWGENTQSLTAVEENNNVGNLVTVDLLKNTPIVSTVIGGFGMKNVSFTSTGRGKILITEKASSFYRGSIWELNLKTLEMRTVFSEEPGLLLKIFPDLSGGVKFSSPDKLLLATIGGEIKRAFTIKTVPDKCGGSGEKFYCFVPTNIPGNAFLPDDYFKNKLRFIDGLYEIDQKTGEDKVVLQSGAGGIPAIDGENVSLKGDRLYFINKYDKRLYRINLPLLESGKQNNVE